MKNIFTLLFYCALSLWGLNLSAQTTITQTQGPFTLAGTNNLAIPFNISAPVGCQVVGIEVDIVWTVAPGCNGTASSPSTISLQDYGFSLQAPSTVASVPGPAAVGSIMYFAPSNNTASALTTVTGTTTGATWTGSTSVLRDTVKFKSGISPIVSPTVAATHPDLNPDIVGPIYNCFDSAIGINSNGTWVLGLENYANSGVGLPALCIESITLSITCCSGSLSLNCNTATTVQLDASGNYSLAFSDFDDGTSDTSCTLQSISFATPNYDCSDLGTNPVQMTVTDLLGNTANCTVNVTVEDTTAPVETMCGKTYDVYFDSSGIYRFRADTFLDITNPAYPEITDNCPGLITVGLLDLSSIGQPYKPFIDIPCTMSNGFLLVEYTDASGNTSTPGSCAIIINPIDTIKPEAKCDTFDVYFTPTSPTSVTVLKGDLNDGSIDYGNCSPPLSLNGIIVSGSLVQDVTYNCEDTGKHVLVLEVEDAAGLKDTCSSVITVIDTITPNAICQSGPITAQLDPSTNTVAVVPLDLDNGSTDNCVIKTFLINGQTSETFDCNDIAASPITATLTVIDESSNRDSCTTSINVVDVTGPVVNCQSSMTVHLNSVGTVSVSANAFDNGSIDACTGTNLSFSFGFGTGQYDCSHVAASPLNQSITIEDAYGNSNICIVPVTVLDTFSPILSCTTAVDVAIDANTGFGTLLPVDIIQTISDNCSNTFDSTIAPVTTGSLVFTPSIQYSCVDVGTAQTAIVNVEDDNNNNARCTVTVNVIDTVAPEALCYNKDTLYLNPSGQASLAIADVDSASTDNCGAITTLINGQSSLAFDCTNVNQTNTVTLTVTDNSSISSTCTTNIIVEDTIKPSLGCLGSYTVNLNAFGNAIMNVSDLIVFENDNCGINTRYFNSNLTSTITYNCTNLGTQTVNLTIEDIHGNDSTCAVNVTVKDVTPPQAICKAGPITYSVGASGSVTILPTDIDNGSIDLCSPPVTLEFLTGIDTTFDCNDIGVTHTLTLQVTDAENNQSTCATDVYIDDLVDPVPQCLTNIDFHLDAVGNVMVYYQDVLDTVVDNCPNNLIYDISFGPVRDDSLQFDCSHAGTQVVTLFVTDTKSGNDYFCTSTIEIIDTINPVANCQVNPVTIQLPANSSSVTLNPVLLDDGSTDNCPSSLSYSSSQTIFTCNDVAASPVAVTLTVTDGNGNTASCPALVDVVDLTPPTMRCKPGTVYLSTSGTAFILASTINNGSSDNCSPVTYTVNGQSNLSVNCSDIGFQVITLEGTDPSGLKATCQETVWVLDTLAPTVVCNSNLVSLSTDTAGQLNIVPADIDNGSFDVCGIASYTVSPSNFNCPPLSTPFTVTLTVTDSSGNSDSCTAQVEAVDRIGPNMVCRDTTVYLSALGTASLSYTQIDGGSYEPCPNSSIIGQSIGFNTPGYIFPTVSPQSNLSLNCSHLGVQQVVLEMKDAFNNSDSCHALVTVLDTIAPNALCKAQVTAYLDISGTATVAAITLDSSSNDVCALDAGSFLINGQPTLSYNCTDVGNTYTVFLSVADSSGNRDTCTSELTIGETIAPTAICKTAPTTLFLDPTVGTAVVNAIQLNNGSSDNCGTANLTYLVNGQAADTLTCNDVALDSITLVVVDAFGNEDSCKAPISVQDIAPPVITACQGPVQPSYDVVLYTNTQVGVAVNTLIDPNTITDNCGIASILEAGTGADTVYFDCSSILAGVNIVTVQVTDNNGLTNQCDVTINVIDSIPPLALCRVNPIAYVDAAGQVAVTYTDIDSASIGSCTSLSYTLQNASQTDTLTYSCSDIGQTLPVELIVSSGNLSDTCTTNVVVKDTLNPIALCQASVAVQITGAGQTAVTISASQINNGSNDNCGVDSLLINGKLQETYSCNTSFSPVAVLTVKDKYGNEDTCHTNIAVADFVAPEFNACPNQAVAVYVDNTGQVSVNASTIVGGATDNCQLDRIEFDVQPAQTDLLFGCPTQLNGTAHTHDVIAYDVAGNTKTCPVVILVKDSIKPTAKCKLQIPVQLDANGEAFVNYTMINQGSFDNCNPINAYNISSLQGVGQLLTNGDIKYDCSNLAVGTDNIQLIVSDLSGNKDTCTTQVDIQDNIQPQANCLDTLVANLGVNCSVIVTGNDLNDTITPSQDNCGIRNYLIDNAASQIYTSTGTYTAILTVEDNSGQTAVCPTTIIVEDNLAPEAYCNQEIVLQLDQTGTAILAASALDSASTDNCSSISLSINTIGQAAQVYTCVNVGDTATVTLYVQDASGNLDSCTTEVMVEDTIPPTVNCISIPLVKDLSNSNGPIVILPSELDPSNVTNDICGLNTTFVLNDTIDCSSDDTTIVYLVARDVNGNEDTCSVPVIVNKGVEPNAYIQAAPDTVAALCEYDTLQLKGVEPSTVTLYNVNWSGPNNFTSTIANPIKVNLGAQDEGYYVFTITQQNGRGCPSADSVYLRVKTVPTPVLTLNDPICDGDSAIMTITNASTYTATPLNFQWHFNGAVISGANNAVYTIPTATFSNNGDYTVKVDMEGCIDSTSIPLILDIKSLPPLPQPSASDPCDGDSLALFANPQDLNRVYTYQWSGPQGFADTIANPVIDSVGQLNVGTYSVTITDSFGCSSSADSLFGVRARPIQPGIEYNAPLCYSDLLELTDTTVYPTTPTYYWTLADSTVATTTIPQLIVADAPAGTYSLQVGMNNCLSQIDTEIVVYEPIPVAVPDAFTVPFRDSIIGVSLVDNDTARSVNLTILESNNGATIRIKNNGVIDYLPKSSFFGKDTLVYSICDVDCPNACDTAMVVIDVTTDFECFIPQAISPNDDGLNDQLRIRCIHDYPQAEIRIFSRWGNEVYKGAASGWNGRFRGKDLPDGTYFYFLKLNDTTYVPKDEFQGYIIIQR